MIKAFISDLHLEEKRPDIADLFKQFLSTLPKIAESLYILGDFFEKWIGDDDLTPFNIKIIDTLKKTTESGLPIFFMHGNRDFLIGKKFLKMTGCTLLPDEYVINIFGTPTLLMHGDSLCTQDIKYQKFRKKSRSWLFKKWVSMYSLEKRRAIAERYREASKAHTSTTAEYLMDVTDSEVVSVMQKHQVQHLIHGHTHRPFVHQFELNGTTATRTVLGPWHEHGSALICSVDGKREMINIK